MKCCGVSGIDDWENNVYFNCSNEMNKSGEKCGVPHSCCINVSNSLSHLNLEYDQFEDFNLYCSDI